MKIEPILFHQQEGKITVTWQSHVSIIDYYHGIAVLPFGGGLHEFLKLIHGHILTNDGSLGARIRVVDTNWIWWRWYLCFDFIMHRLRISRMWFYKLLFKYNMLATKKGYIPSWHDIRLFGIKKKG